MIVRFLLALVFVLAVFALIGPVTHLLGIPVGQSVLTIIKVCTLAGAAVWVLKGIPPRA